MRRLALLAAAILPFCTGCGKYIEDLVIYPDGSGKMTFRIAVWENLRKQQQDTGQIPQKAFDLAVHEGFAAFTDVVESNDAGWTTVTFTGYFEDINAVKVLGPDKKPRMTFAFKPDGAGFVLEVEDALLESAVRVPPEKHAETWTQMQPQLTGFEVARRVKMPGKVTKALPFFPGSKDAPMYQRPLDPVEKETPKWREDRIKETRDRMTDAGLLKDLPPEAIERVVEYRILGEWAKELAEIENMAIRITRKITCGPSEVKPEELAAFRKELEDAKAKAKARAEAEKKK